MDNASKLNPERVYKVIADIISRKEGVKITVVSVTEKESQQTA